MDIVELLQVEIEDVQTGRALYYDTGNYAQSEACRIIEEYLQQLLHKVEKRLVGND